MSSPDFEVSVVHAEHGLTELSWHRPGSANAFSAELVDRLIEALAGIANDGRTKVLLLRAARWFSAGFDLDQPDTDERLAWRFARCEHLLAALRSLPAVSVASIEGPAFGAGADLAAACDFRLGTDNARFRFPGSRFGIVLGTGHLARLVGRECALDIVLRNKVVSAQEALEVGLLTSVCAREEHGEFARELAGSMADLERPVLASLLAASRDVRPDGDLAALTTSVMCSGLAERVAGYRAAAKR